MVIIFNTSFWQFKIFANKRVSPSIGSSKSLDTLLPTDVILPLLSMNFFSIIICLTSSIYLGSGGSINLLIVLDKVLNVCISGKLSIDKHSDNILLVLIDGCGYFSI